MPMSAPVKKLQATAAKPTRRILAVDATIRRAPNPEKPREPRVRRPLDT